ncbi:DUF6338 family protein [Shewanella sp.]|jgi:hypothetical protein|uniref:DUF6338 family protein n=1 Tax=Shewanella sp. TaxID=50422 RepID=UPI003D136CAE
MKVTFETLNLLLLLFPGLLSSRIIQVFRRRKSQDHVDMLFDVLIFSFLTYVFVEIFYKWEPIFSVSKNTDGTFKYVANSNYCSIGLTLVVSVLLPVVVGAVIHHDLHMRLLRLLRVTNRTSRETAWDDVFTSLNRYVTVHFKNGNRLTGWPMYYSNTPDEGYLYVHDAAWIDNDGNYIESNSHGILINKEEVQFIEFMLTNAERSQSNEQ